jgi:hypothetical protein
MRIADHKIVKILNGILRKAQMQELYADEAEILVLHYMERYPVLDRELVLPYRDVFQHMPFQFYKRLLQVVTIMIEELMDLLFTMRGIESVYCIRGRDYHEN